MADMVPLGYGTFVRADRIVLLQPLRAGERAHGARTRVWIDGVPDPIVASRSERAILIDMGELDPARPRMLEEPPPARQPGPPSLFDDAAAAADW